MGDAPPGWRSSEIAVAARIRPVDVDDLSTVRYIHSAAVRLDVHSQLTEEEKVAYIDLIYSQDYADNMMRQRLFGAELSDGLVATAGWSVGNDTGTSVRVRALFVRPPFAGLGLGGRLLEFVESDAATAGFTVYSVRTPIGAVPFFESHGYKVTSHGIRLLAGGHSMPVCYLRKPPGGDANELAD